MSKNINFKKYITLIIGVVIAVLIDQYTKYLAVSSLKGNAAIELIRNVFELRYLENCGAAFGMLQDQRIFFLINTLIILVVLFYFYNKIPADKKYVPLKICAGLIVAGAIGNMIDRMRLKYVVDFFYFKLIDFPIFNVADCYVVVGCILFAVLILFYYKDEDLQCFRIKKAK